MRILKLLLVLAPFAVAAACGGKKPEVADPAMPAAPDMSAMDAGMTPPVDTSAAMPTMDASPPPADTSAMTPPPADTSAMAMVDAGTDAGKPKGKGKGKKK